MATEQDHVWAMLDDMQVFLAKRHVPTPERTYKLDGGWTLAMDDLRGFADRLVAERDAIRQQLAAAVERAERAENLIFEAHQRAFGERHYAYVDSRTTVDLLVADLRAAREGR